MRSASPAAKEAQKGGSLPACEAAVKVAPRRRRLVTAATSRGDQDQESWREEEGVFSRGGALSELTNVCRAPGGGAGGVSWV
jgi:hypothetical protein